MMAFLQKSTLAHILREEEERNLNCYKLIKHAGL